MKDLIYIGIIVLIWVTGFLLILTKKEPGQR